MRLAAILLVAFVLAEVPALYYVAETQAAPTTETVTTPLFSYETATVFNYTATVTPNALSNATTIGSGGATLFTAEVRALYLAFNFSVTGTGPATLHLRLGWVLVLSGGLWNRTLNYTTLAAEATESLAGASAFSGSTRVNLTQVEQLAGEIQNETRYAPTALVLEFRPIAFLELSPPNQSAVTALYSPQLNLTIGSSVITPGNLSSTSGGGRTVTTLDAIPSTGMDRLLAIAAATVLGIGAIACASLTGHAAYLDRRKHIVQRKLREMTAPYQEAIAMTGTPPSTENLVALGTWEGLVRVADMLGKPILRYEHTAPDGEWRYFFYVLDGATQYTYLLPRAKELLKQDEAS